MSQGSTAYASYVRIHEEMGRRPLPDWSSLSHVRRMAWEAAAQAVALAVLPRASDPEGDQAETGDHDTAIGRS